MLAWLCPITYTVSPLPSLLAGPKPIPPPRTCSLAFGRFRPSRPADALRNAPRRYVTNSNKLIEGVVTVGQLNELPAAQLHYEVNPDCQPAVYIAIFPLGMTTQLALSALAAVGPTLARYYAPGAVPAPYGTPFSTSPECAKRCQQEGGAANATASSPSPAAAAAAPAATTPPAAPAAPPARAAGSPAVPSPKAGPGPAPSAPPAAGPKALPSPKPAGR